MDVGSIKVKVNAYLLATSGKKTLQRCSERMFKQKGFQLVLEGVYLFIHIRLIKKSCQNAT